MSNAAQRSFSKGELAPALYGRTDQIGYATGLRTCRNFQVLKSGGIENRPGTQYIGAVASNSVARLIPFVFNESQAYVLEFTDSLIRFIRGGAYLGGPYTVATPYLASELAALRFTQSADVLTLVHPNHPPAKLSRLGDLTWTYSVLTFAPSIDPPANVVLSPAGSGTFVQYVVTAVDSTTGQESFASTPAGYASVEGQPKRTVKWDVVATAKAYNVYKGFSADGTTATDFGFIGSTGTRAFLDSGITPDMENRAPVARNPFSGANNYPSAVGYYQQRQTFGGTLNDPQTIWASRSGDYNNMTISSPIRDDDALTFPLVTDTVSTIQHLHTNDALLAFTTGGEWVVKGDGSGVLRPTDINALNFAKHGIGRLRPLQIDARVLYVQGRQAIVRDLSRDPFRGYQGNDLTVFATHLFKGYQLVDWAYQENPDSIIWCVRSDGTLLGLTDVAEQQMIAWHRHDTLGTFENVCVIPEGGMDAVYVVVNRSGTRFVERFRARFFTDVEDCALMDASLTYDGRNTNASKTMTLTGGSTWEYDASLTCTCSASEFTAGDVGNAIVLTGADGASVMLTIATYSSPTVVTGFPQKTVPTSLQGVAVSDWARAVDEIAGLGHLEGRALSVFADGYVVASPNNPAVGQVVVSGGSATLDRPYSYIHAGLPYVSDVETLDIDSGEGPSLKARKILINDLVLVLEQSRGVFAGPDAPADETTTGLVEFKARETEDYNVPVSLRTGTIDMKIPTHWNTSGHVFIRQVDPVPLTILGIIPTGHIPPA